MNLLRHQLLTVCKKKGKVLASEGEDMGAAFFIIAGQVVVSMKKDGKNCRFIDYSRWWRDPF